MFFGIRNHSLGKLAFYFCPNEDKIHQKFSAIENKFPLNLEAILEMCNIQLSFSNSFSNHKFKLYKKRVNFYNVDIFNNPENFLSKSKFRRLVANALYNLVQNKHTLDRAKLLYSNDTNDYFVDELLMPEEYFLIKCQNVNLNSRFNINDVIKDFACYFLVHESDVVRRLKNCNVRFKNEVL